VGESMSNSFDSEAEKEMFSFERGEFFGGSLDYRIKNMHFSMRPYNAFCKMQQCEFDITERELLKIVSIIAPVTKWKENYDNTEFILDGYGWHIKYSYKGVNIYSHGYEAYPEDYKLVIGELQNYMEELCKKYAPEGYSEEEAVRRRSL